MSCQCLECQCGFKDIEFNSEEQYLEFMRIQEEILREKNVIEKPENLYYVAWIQPSKYIRVIEPQAHYDQLPR